MLKGRPGWPDATMYRYHALRDNYPNSDYVFLSDADMRFEAPVGPEILPDTGLVATLHPGYVTTPRNSLPYETREKMETRVLPDRGGRYFCGGFVGGTRLAMNYLSCHIANAIDHDVDVLGQIPVWHDESALNQALSYAGPRLALSPSYCYPDDDSYYRSIWPEEYERKLVALDKTAETRGVR
jgi:hypothetical protein